MPFRSRLGRVLFCAALAGLAMPPLLVLPLRWVHPPTTAYMLRTAWQTEAGIHYNWTDLENIDPALARAVIAAEDQTFPVHNGFVWQAIYEAWRHNLSSESVRGGSSITQQTAKNLFLWPATSYIRKAIEAYFTVWLEMLLSKRRILELYVNIAQFGEHTFGAAAAAERFFGIPPARLSRARAALLAAVLPAPTEYDVTSPSAYVRHRQDWILGQMDNLGRAYLNGMLSHRR